MLPQTTAHRAPYVVGSDLDPETTNPTRERQEGNGFSRRLFKVLAMYFSVDVAAVTAGLAWLFNAADSSVSASGGAVTWDGEGVSASGIITFDFDQQVVDVEMDNLSQFDHVNRLVISADRTGGSDPLMVEVSVANVSPDGSAFEDSFMSDGAQYDLLQAVLEHLNRRVLFPGGRFNITIRCAGATDAAPVRVKLSGAKGAGFKLDRSARR